jgi:hypothetical protein
VPHGKHLASFLALGVFGFPIVFNKVAPPTCERKGSIVENISFVNFFAKEREVLCTHHDLFGTSGYSLF